jgi:hypothetical protein
MCATVATRASGPGDIAGLSSPVVEGRSPGAFGSWLAWGSGAARSSASACGNSGRCTSRASLASSGEPRPRRRHRLIVGHVCVCAEGTVQPPHVLVGPRRELVRAASGRAAVRRAPLVLRGRAPPCRRPDAVAACREAHFGLVTAPHRRSYARDTGVGDAHDLFLQLPRRLLLPIAQRVPLLLQPLLELVDARRRLPQESTLYLVPLREPATQLGYGGGVLLLVVRPPVENARAGVGQRRQPRFGLVEPVLCLAELVECQGARSTWSSSNAARRSGGTSGAGVRTSAIVGRMIRQ